MTNAAPPPEGQNSDPGQPYAPQPPQPQYGYQPYPPPYGYQTYPYGYGYPPPTPAPAPRKRHRLAISSGIALVTAGVVVAAVAATTGSTPVAGSGSNGSSTQQLPDGNRGGGNYPFPNIGNGGGSSQTSANVATTAQQRGIVVINSVLGYQGAISAGTGMVLTSDGEILTNNHVIEGATRITVTIASTGTRYSATVVGTDATDDVAVIKLANASGLQTANFDQGDTVRAGDKVTAVGNAGGTGTLTAADGKVVATGRSITASDETGTNPEKLKNLIQVDANVVAGDSGGPLYDSQGEVIGMDTAAAASRTTSAGYAITISDAMTVVAQIDKGVATSKVHIGLPGLLGVTVSGTSSGAVVQQVVDGSAAAKAGIEPGDVITRLGSTAITSSQALHTAVGATKAGQQVSVTWTDGTGTTHRQTVTLGTGPAD